MEKTRHTDIEMQLEKLYREARPGTFLLEVRKLTRNLVGQGYRREDLLEDLEHYRFILRERGEEDREDDIVDVMDQLDGWCAEHARI